MPPPPIDVVSLSAASSGAVAWRMAGVDRLTVVVKATFALVQNGIAPLVSPSALVREDQLRDRSGAPGSLRRATEIAPYLPVAGVVVSGQACAPAGRPQKQIAVRLAVTRSRALIDKTLHVYGDRAPSAPAATPFQRMPIVYERAFGGPSIEDNPVGVGAAAGSPAPNIVDPSNPTNPVGFGPIAAHWPARRRLLRGAPPPDLGGVAAIPDGFDWTYFCAAPADQRIDFLRGNEWITLDGLAASVSRLQTRLPSAKACVRYWLDRPIGDGAARSVDMVADTLAIDVDRQICSIIWRGSFVVGLEALSSLHVLTGVELPNEPIVWPEIAGVELAADSVDSPGEGEQREEAEPITARRPPMLEAPAPAESNPGYANPPAPLLHDVSDDPDPDDRFTGTLKVDVEKIARVAALPFRNPAEVEPPKPILTAEDVDEDELFTRTAHVDVAALERAALPFRKNTEARAVGRVSSNEGLPFQARPASKPPTDEPSTAPLISLPSIEPPLPFAPSEPPPSAPPPSPSPPPAQAVVEPPAVAPASEISPARGRALERLAANQSFDDADFAGADLHELDFTGRSLARVNFRGADLRGARFTNAKLAGAQLAEADLTGADLGSSDLARADLARAKVNGASFERARIEDVKLSGASGAKAIFRGATGRRTGFTRGSWEDAIFDEADLGSADFTGSTLDRASFRGASLADVRLNEARGVSVTFEGARITSARARGATLRGCSFDGADARHAAFAKADLREATFAGANLEGANLSEALCAGASFTDANLGDAILEHADLTGAKLKGARLEGAKLQLARGEGADLGGANLAGADLRLAKFPGASFVGAAMQGARADEIDLAGARLVRADLSRACLRGAHLERAVLAHARLDATDLRNAILEGANVHGASRATAKMGGANLGDLVETDPDDPGAGAAGS